MAKSQDYTKLMQDMMGAFPVDMSAFQDVFKNSNSMNEKFARVALDAADKSAEISTRWTKDTLSKIGDVTTVKDEAADYSTAMTNFASLQAELASENMAAFAEVAKKVQMETVELMLAAGKDMGDEAQAAVKTATDEVKKATKKATASAK